jgi:hypothetical protein
MGCVDPNQFGIYTIPVIMAAVFILYMAFRIAMRPSTASLPTAEEIIARGDKERALARPLNPPTLKLVVH